MTAISRASDEARLFNPAFCGVILFEAITSFTKLSEGGMPFPAAFLVLPLVLPKATRAALPKRLAPGNGLASWTIENPQLRIGFQERVRVLVPVTQEALCWLFRHAALQVLAEANLLPQAKCIGPTKDWAADSEEIEECMVAARFVGRWLASSGPPHNTFALLGVKP